MSGLGRRAFVLALVALVALATLAVAAISLGADGEGVTQTVAPERDWTVDEYLADGSLIPLIEDRLTGGIVNRSYGLGKLDRPFDPLDGDGLATAKIFSNDTGRTWWISSESQSRAAGLRGPEIGSYIEFEQLQGFQKTDAGASLRLVFTKVFIDALDHNGFVLPSECVVAGTDDEDLCSSLMWGSLDVVVKAWTADRSLNYRTDGDLYLEGRQGYWSVYPNLDAGLSPLFWKDSDFEIDKDVDGDGGLHAIARLPKPVVVDIPLSGPGQQVDEQEVFALQITAVVETTNDRGRESWLAVYLRDPVETGGNATGGAAIEVTGLTPTNDFPRDPPPDVVPTPAPCPAPDPNAGILLLDVPEPRRLEMHGARWQVAVNRTGGSRGAVSATLTAHDGTATAGSDFVPLTTAVTFADGDTGPRNLAVRVATDAAIEPNETLRLALSDPGGCATLDDRSSAELTILDDDAPITLPTLFTVGGTVEGLVGTGLVLQDHHGLFLEIFENGSFTFADLPSPPGSEYAVSVFNQPREPSQHCTVAHGTGTFTDTSVTDVLVTCVGS